jgi:hypothetical protein
MMTLDMGLLSICVSMWGASCGWARFLSFCELRKSHSFMLMVFGREFKKISTRHDKKKRGLQQCFGMRSG